MPPLMRKLMDYGDKIVAYFDPETQFLIMLQDGKTFDCKYGHFNHSNFVGKEFGSKVALIERDHVEPKDALHLRDETGPFALYCDFVSQDADPLFDRHRLRDRQPACATWHENR